MITRHIVIMTGGPAQNRPKLAQKGHSYSKKSQRSGRHPCYVTMLNPPLPKRPSRGSPYQPKPPHG